jgi:hypothetical protein
MKIGFIRSALYYLIGLGLAALSYATMGHPYIHAPGLHHLIILITFAGGFLYLVLATVQYYKGPRKIALKGIIFTNLFMSLGFGLYIAYIIIDTNYDAEFEKNVGRIIIEESGDTTTMYNEGSPVYVKVKDSVLLNFIDSTKIDWNEVEHREK